MTADLTAQPEATAEHTSAARDVDPKSLLRPGLRVVGEQGRALGTLDTFTRDAAGQVTSLTVRHGLIRRGLTNVPAARVKQVNADSVMLEFSAAQFKRLPPAARA
jgi:hypothetical protein